MKGVDLIISTYNSPAPIDQILSFIRKGSLLPSSIHIADDGSSSDNQLIMKDYLKHCSVPSFYHWHEDNGFRKAKILNAAISECKSDYIVFLDGDCLPHKHFVQDHLSVAEKGFFVQGRRCFIKESQVQRLLDKKTTILRLMLSGKVSGLLKSIRLPGPYIKHNKTMYGLLGCNLGVWRDNLIKINGFDEDYEGWGREDSDLCARLYNTGISRKMVYGRALVYHLNHPENDRGNLIRNDKLLKEVLSLGKTRCANGITKG